MEKQRQKSKPRKIINNAQKEIREKIITLMAGAFGLVAALAWKKE